MTIGIKHRSLSLLCVLVVISMLIPACGPAASTETAPTSVASDPSPAPAVSEATPTSQAPESTEPPSGEEPVYGGVFSVAEYMIPPSLDPMMNPADSTKRVAVHIFETLVAFGEDFSIVPMLAEDWEISEDGKTYTFHLRRGIKFHNGKEMTSEDVIASIDRFLEIESRKAQFALLESYEALDDYTVVMHLSSPTAAFLDALATPPQMLAIFPMEVIANKGTTELSADELIGTGPYKFVEYKPDQELVLERFEDYQALPGERDGLGGAKIAYFDEIHFNYVPEAGTRLAGLQVGDYDLAEPMSGQLEQISDNPELQLTVAPYEGTYLTFNHAEEFSGNPKFRQAVLAALEMEPLGLALTAGRSELFDLNPSIVASFTAYYFEDEFASSLYDQNDVEKAQQLLGESGYGDEQLVLVTTRDAADYYRLGMAYYDQLVEKLGLNIKIEVYDWPGFVAKITEKSGWHMAWMGYMTPHQLNPNAWSQFWGCEGAPPWNTHYCGAEMDAAFATLDAATTFEERKEGVKGVQRVFYEDLPMIKVCDYYYALGLRSNIQGFKGWYALRYWGVWRQP